MRKCTFCVGILLCWVALAASCKESTSPAPTRRHSPLPAPTRGALAPGAKAAPKGTSAPTSQPATRGGMPASAPGKRRPPHTKGASGAGYPVQVKDSDGVMLRLERAPRRIVVGGNPVYTELVIDLGARERLVGITDSADNPPEAKGIATIGRSWPLNLERVLQARPDLVLGVVGRFRQKLRRDAKVKVFGGGHKGGYLRSLADIYLLIRQVSRLLYGNERRATKMLRRLKAQIARLEKKVQGLPRRKAAIIYLYKPQGQRIYVERGGGLGDELLRRARGTNVFGTKGPMALSIEQLLVANPSVLFTAPKHVSWVLSHRALRRLAAVRHKRVFGIPASHYTSSRNARVLRQMIKALHHK